MKLYDKLSYEQILALQIMHNEPNMEASSIAKEADCSWDELFVLAEMKLIDIGVNRIKDNQIHPKINTNGLLTLIASKMDGVL